MYDYRFYLKHIVLIPSLSLSCKAMVFFCGLLFAEKSLFQVQWMDFSYLSFSINFSMFVCLFFLISFQFSGQTIFALLCKIKF